MKTKQSTSLLLLAFVLFSMTFSSCTKDQEIGMNLTRCWHGNLFGTCTYNGYTYNITSTTIRFWSDAFKLTTGYGKWMDNYSSRNAPWGSYYACNFDWYVENQDIYITFKDREGSKLRIRDYRINNKIFDGYLDEYNPKTGKYEEVPTGFTLNAVSSNDEPVWSSYDYDRYYYTWNSLTRGQDSASDSTRVEMEVTPERHYNQR